MLKRVRLTGARLHALDVVGALRKSVDTSCGENHHIFILRLEEVPLPPVDENEIARRDGALPELLSGLDVFPV